MKFSSHIFRNQKKRQINWGDKRSPRKILQNLSLHCFITTNIVTMKFSLSLKHHFQNASKKVIKPSILGAKEPFLVLGMTQTAQKRLDGGPTVF